MTEIELRNEYNDLNNVLPKYARGTVEYEEIVGRLHEISRILESGTTQPMHHHGVRQTTYQHGAQQPMHHHGVRQTTYQHGAQQPIHHHGVQQPPRTHSNHPPAVHNGTISPDDLKPPSRSNSRYGKYATVVNVGGGAPLTEETSLKLTPLKGSEYPPLLMKGLAYTKSIISSYYEYKITGREIKMDNYKVDDSGDFKDLTCGLVDEQSIRTTFQMRSINTGCSVVIMNVDRIIPGIRSVQNDNVLCTIHSTQDLMSVCGMVQKGLKSKSFSGLSDLNTFVTKWLNSLLMLHGDRVELISFSEDYLELEEYLKTLEDPCEHSVITDIITDVHNLLVSGGVIDASDSGDESGSLVTLDEIFVKMPFIYINPMASDIMTSTKTEKVMSVSAVGNRELFDVLEKCRSTNVEFQDSNILNILTDTDHYVCSYDKNTHQYNVM